MRTFNFQTNKTTDIYSDSLNDFAINPDSKVIALSVEYGTYIEPPDGPGIYAIEDSSKKLQKVKIEAEMPVGLKSISWGKYDFVADGKAVIAFNENGASKKISDKLYQAFPSPDGKILALFAQWYTPPSSKGLEIVDQDLNCLFTFPDVFIEQVIWKPDSSGIFFLASGKLYYANIPSQTPPILVDDQMPSELEAINMDFGWIR